MGNRGAIVRAGRLAAALLLGGAVVSCQSARKQTVEQPRRSQVAAQAPAPVEQAAPAPRVVRFQGRVVSAMPDELLVVVQGLAPTSLLRLERATGGTVSKVSGFTDAVILSLPAGASLDDAARAARTVPWVTEVRPNAIVRGAGDTPTEPADEAAGGAADPEPSEESAPVPACAEDPAPAWAMEGPMEPPASQGTADAELYSYQWHLHRSHAAAAWAKRHATGEGVVVAVLDTGVSHIPSLPAARLLPGYNALSPGASAADDHGHGTHMASIIASHGSVLGVAPDATILPIKVLDAGMVGTELALVDGLLYAAYTPGVQVINMSLALPPDYLPSQLLSKAIDEVAGLGIVLVAASGNDGLPSVAFPAAFPEVIAVGGVSLVDAEQSLGDPGYSNRGAALDLAAFGGSLEDDFDGDGVPDGILGESVDPLTGDSGAYVTAGTSPAAAQVSGAAAVLIGAGAPRDHIRHLLQLSAADVDGDGIDKSTGAGVLNVGEAMRLLDSPCYLPALDSDRFFVESVVYFSPVGKGVKARAIVRVTNDAGEPLKGIKVRGHFRGLDLVDATAVTNGEGLVKLMSGVIPSPDEGFVAFSVDHVVHPLDGHPVRPVSAASYDLSTWQLFSNLSGGLSSDAVVLDVDPAAIQALGVPSGEVLPTLMMRPMGTGFASNALIFAFTPTFYAASGLPASTMVFHTTGVGLASSAIIVDQAFFSAPLQQVWGTDTVVVRAFTQGSGLAASAMVWGGEAFPADALFSGTSPQVLRTVNGAGLASSAIVWNESLLNPALYTPVITVRTATKGVGLASSALVQDLSSEVIAGLGQRWARVTAMYPTGAGLASSALVAQFNPYAYWTGTRAATNPTMILQASSPELKPFVAP